jgi:hypothetical protein
LQRREFITLLGGAAARRVGRSWRGRGELRLANGVTLLAKFDGEFASHSSTYAGTETFPIQVVERRQSYVEDTRLVAIPALFTRVAREQQRQRKSHHRPI